MTRNIVLCKEMKKLRAELDKRGIPWTDNSKITTDEELQRCTRLYFSLPASYYDTSIYRTKFTYNGKQYSVINGYGTYGGYEPWNGKNNNLLEMMIDDNDPIGWLTADDVCREVGINNDGLD